MPNEFHHPYDREARRKGRRGTAPTTPRQAVPEPTDSPGPVVDPLAQFSLLADPATISGEASGGQDGDRDDEIQRLRAALHARELEAASRSIESTPVSARAELENATAIEQPVLAHGGLLNVAEARRLAEDARAREQSSRAELASARADLGGETATEPRSEPNAGAGRRSWQRRPLVGVPPKPDTTPSPLEDKQTTAGQEATPFGSPTRESFRAMRAENRELRAMLAIAKDTAVGQRTELARLRRAFADQDSGLDRTQRDDPKSAFDPPQADARMDVLQRALDEARAELWRLREQSSLNEQETEARDAERSLLRRTLAERENEIAARNVQLDDLRDRFEAQNRALENTRVQFERERNQNTALQELLTRLRETLGVDRESTIQAAADPVVISDAPSPKSQPFAQRALEENVESRPEGGPATRPVSPLPNASQGRPAVFDAWQDDQIRRHFGPMGIDTIIDLLREPLARRTRPGEPDLRIVLLGRGAWGWAIRLVDGLVQNGTPAFTIHVGDPREDRLDAVRDIPHDSPAREFLRPLPFPDSPASLASTLANLDPAVLISRDFLSSFDDVMPWLEVLSDCTERGSGLLFSECTGVDSIDVPEEISAIGNRIWELMPDRYTRIAGSQECLESWSEALARSETRAANDLLRALRDRFSLEMLAQFGFLAEPFVGSPIASNFDARSARDLKFLRQVADLDDRKIEAGNAPALHLVALVEPHEPD